MFKMSIDFTALMQLTALA